MNTKSLFSLNDNLEMLSHHGDPLEILERTVDFEYFRLWLVEAVRLVPDKGKSHDWQPARWGAAQAETFVVAEQELRAGDRVQFMRNNHRAELHNGDIAEVGAIDPAGSSMVVEREDGRSARRPGYRRVGTIWPSAI